MPPAKRKPARTNLIYKGWANASTSGYFKQPSESSANFTQKRFGFRAVYIEVRATPPPRKGAK